jgi:hypothetical protein
LFFKLPNDIQTAVWAPSGQIVEEMRIGCGLILRPFVGLLKSYQPRKWAKHVQDVYDPPRVGFRLENLLWFQVVMLDIAIRILVRGSVEGMRDAGRKNDSGWSTPEMAALVAIVQSWGPHIVLPSDRQGNDMANAKTQLQAVSSLSNASSPAGAEPEPETRASVATANPVAEKPEGGGTSEDRLDWSAPCGSIEVPFQWGTDTEPASGASVEDVLESQAATDTEPEMQPWDLEDALRAFAGLDWEHNPHHAERIRRLADLLKLRALFYLAFLMIIPDSTDVYLVQKSEVEMPMM